MYMVLSVYKIVCNIQLNSDVLGCIKYNDGSTAAIDTWCPSPHKTNELDNDQVSDPNHLSPKKSWTCSLTIKLVYNIFNDM